MPLTQVKTFWGFPASEAGAQALDNDINAWLSSKPDIEVLHIGQSQSQAADHGSPRVTISIFYRPAPRATPVAAPPLQDARSIGRPQLVKKGEGKTGGVTMSKSRSSPPKPEISNPAPPPPPTVLPGEEAMIRRRREIFLRLKEAAASLKPGDNLRISRRDSLEIRRLQASDLVDRGYGIGAAERIVQAAQKGDFDSLGVVLRGILITVDEDGPDLIALKEG